MEKLLTFYVCNKDWIDFVKDLVFFAGAVGLIKLLINWNFEKKKQRISENLRFRDEVEDKLQQYVLDKFKNGIKDIGIRLVHWKNYPWKLENDGFKHTLWVRQIDERTMPSGWIDNTGVNFREDPWFLGNSIYLDRNGIFFFDKVGQTFKGFQELKDVCWRLHMPFTNIINFDFKEFIEYEPVFYIRYPYKKYEKLYDDNYIIREKPGNRYFRTELMRSRQIKKPNSAKHWYLKLSILLKAKLLL